MQAESSEIILEAGAEGGSLTLFGTKAANGWRFRKEPDGRAWPLARAHEDFAGLLRRRGRHGGGGAGQAGETRQPCRLRQRYRLAFHRTRHDASKFDPDKPLPDNIPESNASKSGRQLAIDLAKRENLTVRQLAQRLGGYSGLAMVGTSKTIADEMEEWLFTESSDGFTVMFPLLAGRA
jgi:alkanesulfonate monooxygenase SsuD/methylene tetrahydromethanopterin reductase-like flavin-dependent oxidoreductase (luciferase family)